MSAKRAWSVGVLEPGHSRPKSAQRNHGIVNIFNIVWYKNILEEYS